MSFSIFAIVSFSILSLRTPLFISANRKLDISHFKSSLPKISIVIPARNEEQRISNLLESISKQSLAPFEVIVVDDESIDDTKSIAKSFGCEVVSAEKRPANLMPKAFASHQGFIHSKGDVILFLDADTVLSQFFVERVALHFCEKNNKVLSVQPFSRTNNFLLSTSLFFHLASIVGSGLLSLIRFRVGIFGPCIAIRREVYEMVGGFNEEQVAQSHIEDVEFGELLKKNKITVERYLGTGLIEYMMYPEFMSMLSGWKKNISAGANKTPLFVLFSIVAVIGSMIALPVNLAANFEANSLSIFLAMQFLIIWLLVINVGVRLGNYFLSSIFYPLALGVFLFVFIQSFYSMLFKKNVQWAGRSLPRNPGN